MFGIRSCKLCGFEGEDDLFQKASDRTSGRKNVCKNCINTRTVKNKNDKSWLEYLEENKNGYYLKRCEKHGDLDYENIILTYKKTRSKYYLSLICSFCELEWRREGYNIDRYHQRIRENKELFCVRCKITYPLSFFNVSELKSKSVRCRNCKIEIDKKYKYNVSMSNRFKFTKKQFDELLSIQNNVCKICKKSETAITNKGVVRNLSVDHCHLAESKGIMKIRGILCHGCNQGLGAFRDNPTYLREAADYLENND